MKNLKSQNKWCDGGIKKIVTKMIMWLSILKLVHLLVEQKFPHGNLSHIKKLIVHLWIVMWQ